MTFDKQVFRHPLMPGTSKIEPEGISDADTDVAVLPARDAFFPEIRAARVEVLAVPTRQGA